MRYLQNNFFYTTELWRGDVKTHNELYPHCMSQQISDSFYPVKLALQNLIQIWRKQGQEMSHHYQ